jgi:hypothetical protein
LIFVCPCLSASVRVCPCSSVAKTDTGFSPVC